jgi:hypothetical protein
MLDLLGYSSFCYIGFYDNSFYLSVTLGLFIYFFDSFCPSYLCTYVLGLVELIENDFTGFELVELANGTFPLIDYLFFSLVCSSSPLYNIVFSFYNDPLGQLAK